MSTQGILDWNTNQTFATGKGATVQEFVATLAARRSR
jgi:hypothetical protein